MAVCLSVSVCLSVHLPVCLSGCLSVSLSVYLNVYLSACLSVSLSVYQSVSLSIYQSVCTSVSLSQSIYLLHPYRTGTDRAAGVRKRDGVVTEYGGAGVDGAECRPLVTDALSALVEQPRLALNEVTPVRRVTRAGPKRSDRAHLTCTRRQRG